MQVWHEESQSKHENGDYVDGYVPEGQAFKQVPFKRYLLVVEHWTTQEEPSIKVVAGQLAIQLLDTVS